MFDPKIITLKNYIDSIKDYVDVLSNKIKFQDKVIDALLDHLDLEVIDNEISIIKKKDANKNKR